MLGASGLLSLFDLLPLTVVATAAASSSTRVRSTMPISFISRERGSTTTFFTRSGAMPKRLKFAGSHCFSRASSAGPSLSSSASIAFACVALRRSVG